jgi:hypothetical protein
MCWEGPTYEDDLQRLKKGGVFPPGPTGLTRAASYDLQRLIEYAFARIETSGRVGRRVAAAVVRRIDDEHTERCIVKYVKSWAEDEANLRFLQWLICQELKLSPSATTAQIEADVIDYLTMELTGREFQSP